MNSSPASRDETPSKPAPKKRPTKAQYLLLIVAGLLIAAGSATLWKRRQTVDPNSPNYRNIVSAFYTGLAAMQSGDDERAGKWLAKATELAPDEPATWADRGLFQLRHNQYDEAAASLEKARQLAPDNSRIEELLGLLEKQRGNSKKAIEHWKRAIKLDPKNLKALFALAQELENSGDTSGAIAKEYVAILKVQPENLKALLEQARIAAKSGDQSTLAAALSKLQKQSGVWGEEARAQLKTLQAAAKGDARNASVQVQFLDNLLKELPQWRQSNDALTYPNAATGAPLTRFLKYPVPSPQPAAPDEKIAFAATPLPDGGDFARFVYKDERKTADIWDAYRTPRANGKTGVPSIRQVSPHGLLSIDWNNDYVSDRVVCGTQGVKFYQAQGGKFVDVTVKTGLSKYFVANSDPLPKSNFIFGDPHVKQRPLLDVKYFGAWAADIESDGDLDIILGRQNGATQVLRNNGDGTWKPLPLWSEVPNLRGFVWADWDRDGDGDAALLLADGTVRAFRNVRYGNFSAWKLPDV